MKCLMSSKIAKYFILDYFLRNFHVSILKRANIVNWKQFEFEIGVFRQEQR